MANIQERAQKYANENFLVSMSHSKTIQSIAENAYIQGANDQINKACQWLEREYAYNGSMAVIDDALIAEFRQAMENEENE